VNVSVQDIQKRVNELFDQKIMNHPFVHDLKHGELTLDQVKGFALNWHACATHLNSAFPLIYFRFIGFILKQTDIKELLIKKIVEETAAPEPGSLMKKLGKFSECLGFTTQDLVNARLFPETFGYISYFDRVFTEGSLAEICASLLPEGLYYRKLFPVIGQELIKQYGLGEHDTNYFMQEGRGSTCDATNGELLERLINTGAIGERPDWGVEYLAETSVRILAFFLSGVYKRPLAGGMGEQGPSELERLLTKS